MRRSSLPNVDDNLVISRSSVRYPNVSRSWESGDFVTRTRAEERLARSVGDRSQERKVLEWCKKNNVNVIRKLPKLDPTILNSRELNTEKFINFVDEAKMVERKKPTKPPDYSKERTPSAEHREKFCKFCQRELPKKRNRRRKRTFFTSPYECEHCGASNDIDYNDDDFVSESKDETTPNENVRDTIRRGNPEQVIDHRTFSEHEENSGNLSKKADDSESDEGDIFWRTDSDFDSFQENLEENFSDLNLEEDHNNTVFLTETTLSNHSNRPVEVKMAWDDDSSNQFAEISRTIATDDGIEAADVNSQDDFDVISQDSDSRISDNSEKTESNSEISGNTNLFPENDSQLRLSPTPPSHSRRGSSPRNFRYSEHRRRNSRELHVTSNEEQNTSDVIDMTRSPIANRSIGLTRIALMRMNRQSRSKSRGTQSFPGTPRNITSVEGPRSHSHDPQDSYSFLDAVSPEIKSVHQNRPHSSDSQNS